MLRDLCTFDSHAVELADAIDACNDHILEMRLDESDIVSVNVLPPTPTAVAEGVNAGVPPRVRVVMVYWQYVPLG